jgi:hypothetical protein
MSEDNRRRALALAHLCRQVNGRARYAASVRLILTDRVGTRCSLGTVIVNRADYRRKDEPSGTLSRLLLYQGPNLVAVLYDATGWEVS